MISKGVAERYMVASKHRIMPRVRDDLNIFAQGLIKGRARRTVAFGD
jgi:hypothetical protein